MSTPKWSASLSAEHCEFLCQPGNRGIVDLPRYVDHMVERRFLEVFQIVVESLHVRAGWDEDPALHQVVPVVEGEFEETSRIRADEARQVIVGDLGACDSCCMKTQREKTSAMSRASGTNEQEYPMGMRPSSTACSTRLFCGLSRRSSNIFDDHQHINISFPLALDPRRGERKACCTATESPRLPYCQDTFKAFCGQAFRQW